MPAAEAITTPAPIIDQGYCVLNSDHSHLAWFGSRLDATSFCLSKSFISASKLLLTDAATNKLFGTFYLGESISNN
ncbi:hypothetical protein ACUUL3_04800 [Thiovibrio sp. JS02]